MEPVRIALPAGIPLPNANRKIHYMVEYRQKKAIKDYAWRIVRLSRFRPMLRADITAVIHPDLRTRRFDPHNWAPSVKAAIDGAVLAGLLPDDSSKYLRAVSFVAGEPVRGWQLELLVTPYEMPSTSMPATAPSSP